MHLSLSIYIYIVIHRQTILLYHNSSVWLDTQDASSWDWNLPNFTLDLITNCSAISAIYVSSGIITHFVLTFICLQFVLSDTRVLNLFKELYITWIATVNSFTRGLKVWPVEQDKALKKININFRCHDSLITTIFIYFYQKNTIICGLPFFLLNNQITFCWF